MANSFQSIRLRNLKLIQILKGCIFWKFCVESYDPKLIRNRKKLILARKMKNLKTKSNDFRLVKKILEAKLNFTNSKILKKKMERRKPYKKKLQFVF